MSCVFEAGRRLAGGRQGEYPKDGDSRIRTIPSKAAYLLAKNGEGGESDSAELTNVTIPKASSLASHKAEQTNAVRLCRRQIARDAATCRDTSQAQLYAPGA